MQSVKLSITLRKRLVKKYSAADVARIDQAVAGWIQADAARSIRTVHVAIDDAAAMKPFKVKALGGTVTAAKVKKVLDALVAKLAPDYVVLFGAGDIVPFFDVANPSRDEAGDDDDRVPTDNPYACSAAFKAGTISSYLVPDRVVGRIPDVPGVADPSWLLDYLAKAAAWTGRKKSAYAKGFDVCTSTWKKAGAACVEMLARPKSSLLVSPPTTRASAAAKRRERSLRHLIKCHGNREDSAFYGEGGGAFPEALRSPDIAGRVRTGTVVGAMCCYGASLFDPASPAAVRAGEPPIASHYLKLGAYGFLGSSTIAWVGSDGMLCADWVVTSFLKAVSGGASLGRAALEAKQEFLRWLQQQGTDPDVADEKTLLQFMLLRDPSIHPVIAAAAPAVPKPAGASPAVPMAAMAAAPPQRRMRREMQQALGRVLRSDLPARTVTASKPPKPAEDAARALLASVPGGDFARAKTRARWTERITRRAPQPSPTPMAAALRRSPAGPAVLEARKAYQYYWVTRLEASRVRRICLATVHTDAAGRVLDTRVVVSS